MNKDIQTLFLGNLKDLTKSMKIKTFHLVDGDTNILVDYKNIDEYSIDSLKEYKILLANKYSKVFLKSNIDSKEQIVEYIAKNCNEFNLTKHKFKIKSNDKFFYFDISDHAKFQFLKRYILFLNEYGDEVKIFKDVEKRNLIFNYIEQLKNKKTEVLNSIAFEELIIELMEDSKHLNNSNMGRKRDIKMFNRRDQKHNSTTRFHSHPFLFILDNNENLLITVELYSASFPVRFLNDKIKKLTDRAFYNIFHKVKEKYK